MVSLVERGHLDSVGLRTVRGLFRVVDARCDLVASWRGGGLDRLLDEGHAALVAGSVLVLRAAGWQVVVEASYSVYGERGSIDILAAHRAAGVALVEEMKTDLTSVEGLARKTDEKERLVRTHLCEERFGFRPSAVGRVLVLPETGRVRRQVERLGPVLDALFPARTRQVRRWIREPGGGLAGSLFLSDTNPRGRIADQRGRLRVRRPRRASG